MDRGPAAVSLHPLIRAFLAGRIEAAESIRQVLGRVLGLADKTNYTPAFFALRVQIPHLLTLLEQPGVDRHMWASSALVAARLLKLQARYDEAQALLRRAIELWTRTDTLTGCLFQELSVIQGYLARFGEALASVDEALRIFDGVDRRSIDGLRARRHRAIIIAYQGRRQDSLDLLVGLVEPFRSFEDPVEMSRTMKCIGHAHGRMGKHQEALAAYEQALSLRQQAAQPIDLFHANILVEQAYILVATGQFNRAESIYDEALRIQIQELGEQHPKVATTIHNKGVMYYHWWKDLRSRGDDALALGELALETYVHARDLRRLVEPVDHPRTATSEFVIGQLLLSLERHADAVQPLATAERLRGRAWERAGRRDDRARKDWAQARWCLVRARAGAGEKVPLEEALHALALLEETHSQFRGAQIMKARNWFDKHYGREARTGPRGGRRRSPR